MNKVWLTGLFIVIVFGVFLVLILVVIEIIWWYVMGG